MERFARQRHNPLWGRRLGLAILPAAALLGGAAFQWGGLGTWVAATVVMAAGVWLNARATDALLTYQFPGIKRRSLMLALGGVAALALAVVVRDDVSRWLAGFMAAAGLGCLLSAGGALIWHFA